MRWKLFDKTLKFCQDNLLFHSIVCNYFYDQQLGYYCYGHHFKIERCKDKIARKHFYEKGW